MNRIKHKFQELRQEGRKAFVAFITAGDPNLKVTEQLVPALARAGADIIELGVPFSDPLADGPTIQAASQRSLKKGTTLTKIFQSVQRIRKESQVPIALMTYYNPVYNYGERRFVASCERCGVDGMIIPDLPPEEAGEIIRFSRDKKIATVFFLSPTTQKKRRKMIIQASSGFIYYVSLTGVTGARKQLSTRIRGNVRDIQKLTNKPICVGFGISTPQQVKRIGRIADGVIVGSAIIKEILKNQGRRDLVKNVSKFVKKLRANL